MQTYNKLSPAIIKLITQEVHRILAQEKKKPFVISIRPDHCKSGLLPPVSQRRIRKSLKSLFTSN